MVTYKQLDSVLLQDGKKYAVNMHTWAEKTLTGQDQIDFQTDDAEMSLFIRQLENNGILAIALVTNTIDTGHGIITIKIGETYTWQDQRLENQKYNAWQARFAADPNVTYNPEVLQE